MPVSVSLPHAMWVETNRAAGMHGMKLSEYIRAAIREQNRQMLTDEPARRQAA